MGFLGAAISLGFMIGPGIGGLLSNISLHFPFYFGGSATILAGVLSFMVLPSIKVEIKDQKKGENIIQQMVRSFKTKYFVLLIVVFVFSFGISNFQATLTMFLTYKFNYTPSDIAIVMTSGGFVGVIIQVFVLNKLFRAFGEMKIILFGLLVAAISLYGMLYVSGFYIILLIATLFSTATTVIRPAVNTLISKLAGHEQGYAAGMNNSYMSLGSMIGPALAGTLFDKNMQLSIYSLLYDKIPENHILKLINDAVDFSFINKLLEKSYCKYYGRPAKEPELMVKLLVLQYLYNLSDERVIEDASLNLAYMYFLDINPDEELPHPSVLAKFRVHKLQDITLDEIIIEIVNQCVEKGIIKNSGISIDATHTEANTFKATPERVMKRLAKKIFKTLDEENGEVPDTINQDIPEYKEIDDHHEAKAHHEGMSGRNLHPGGRKY